MSVITFNPYLDKSGTGRMLYYLPDGVAYTKVNGSLELDSTSIYIGPGASPTTWYEEMFGLTYVSTIPDDEVIINVKLIARVKSDNANQLQRIGLTTNAGTNKYFSSEHSGTTGYANIYYTWTVNPATGVAWVKSDLTSANFYMIADAKQSNPADGYNQFTRFYGEVTTAVPSTFITKAIIF